MKTITRDKIIKSSHDRVHSLSIVHKELETPTKEMSLVQIYGFIVVKHVTIKITRKSNRFNLKQKCELGLEMILIGLHSKIPSGLDIRLIRYSLFYEII